LAGRRFAEVAVSVPTRLLRGIGDEFEHCCCRRRDLALRLHDPIVDHVSIEALVEQQLNFRRNLPMYQM
jgi:hypothetical protein